MPVRALQPQKILLIPLFLILAAGPLQAHAQVTANGVDVGTNLEGYLSYPASAAGGSMDPQPSGSNFQPIMIITRSKLIGLYNDTGSFSTLINNGLLFAITLGAILAVLRLAWAGYLYMGAELWSNKEHAKEIIRETLLGLLLLLAVVLILKLINPDLLSLQVGIKKLDPATQQGSIPCDPSGGCRK